MRARAGVPGHRRVRRHRRCPSWRRRCWPATTWSCSASAGRARPASCARSPGCSTSGARSSPAARSTTTRYEPVCVRCRRLRAELGDDLPSTWRHRDERYSEKLATPDTSVGDLVGDVDPVKVAQGRTLGDPETVHYGLVPRTQPRHLRAQRASRPRRADPGRPVQRAGGARHPGPRLLAAAAARPAARGDANPEDYTNRGRIITPLKDRFGAEIRTHYPPRSSDEVAAHRAGVRRSSPRCPTTCSRCRPVHPRAARVLVGRPALRRLRAVRDRRGRRRRGVGAAAAALERRGPQPVARVCDLPTVAPHPARQGRVRDGRGGPRGRRCSTTCSGSRSPRRSARGCRPRPDRVHRALRRGRRRRDRRARTGRRPARPGRHGPRTVQGARPARVTATTRHRARSRPRSSSSSRGCT